MILRPRYGHLMATGSSGVKKTRVPKKHDKNSEKENTTPSHFIPIFNDFDVEFWFNSNYLLYPSHFIVIFLCRVKNSQQSEKKQIRVGCRKLVLVKNILISRDASRNLICFKKDLHLTCVLSNRGT